MGSRGSHWRINQSRPCPGTEPSVNGASVDEPRTIRTSTASPHLRGDHRPYRCTGVELRGIGGESMRLPRCPGRQALMSWRYKPGPGAQKRVEGPQRSCHRTFGSGSRLRCLTNSSASTLRPVRAPVCSAAFGPTDVGSPMSMRGKGLRYNQNSSACDPVSGFGRRTVTISRTTAGQAAGGGLAQKPQASTGGGGAGRFRRSAATSPAQRFGLGQRLHYGFVRSSTTDCWSLRISQAVSSLSKSIRSVSRRRSPGHGAPPPMAQARDRSAATASCGVAPAAPASIRSCRSDRTRMPSPGRRQGNQQGSKMANAPAQTQSLEVGCC
jgi:hypothetical protein